MKTWLKLLVVAVGCNWLAGVARADLLGVNPGYPQINFASTDPMAVNYDPTTGMLSVNALPFSIDFSALGANSLIVSNRSLAIALNTDGTIASGTNGFELVGQFVEVVGGVTNTYAGTLLQGDVIAFGYLPSAGIAQYDFRVHLTGGQIQSLFACATDFGIFISSEATTFTGSFTNAFNGQAKGYGGPEDLTPPVITCPPASAAVTTPATDPNNPTNPGFIVTYPSPVATDNCDPNPQIFCDTTSGSFVAGKAGDPLTITCYAIDASGNYSDCAFTITLGESGACSLGFTNGCPPVTLPTDLGSCSATYAFALPVATNCNGQTFVATASAVSESGMVIPLTLLTNGLVAGDFPRTTTTNGDLITFTASDGQGNPVVEQCQVFVIDTQAPTILCLNQAATFKPIVTNALSCIEANFDNNSIAAGNYLWFTSVLQPTACRNGNGAFTVHVFDQTIQLLVDNTNLTLNVPDAYVIFSNGIPSATTIFTNDQWVTYSSLGCRGNTFVAGVAWQLPFNLNNLIGGCWGRDAENGLLRRHVNSASWSARFAVDKPGIALQWQWGAVVEAALSTNFSLLSVKPVDDNYSSCWRNSDSAGSCENFKYCLPRGGCGLGILSQVEPCNLGRGIVCEGPVYFTTPVASDNCGNLAQVTCNPPSGSIFGPGNQLITCTAVDSSGNSNQCTFTLTVLPPLQVVFDNPACDNLADNTAEPDAGFNDMNCPDAASTPEYVTCFRVGDRIPHVCRLLDCDGNDVTAALAPGVTVHIDVTERMGSYTNSVLVNNLTPGTGGTPGCIMVPVNGTFEYTLNTAGYPSGTLNTSKFFRACAWVDYNSSPGVPVGMEDVLLQSR